MGFTKFTKNVLNVSALPDRVQNQASSLKLVFDQAGVDIKAALNALISELEAKVAAANIGADVASVTEKNVQGILTAFENEIANRYTKAETNNAILADTNELIADVKIDLATGLLTVTKKNGTKQTFETSTEAESYAVGGTGTRPGEDTDNAKYYAQIAKQVAGGDFVTVVEMEGYAQKKGLYPNYDETELKGEVIETETTLEAESVLKVHGNSVQETRSGKNLLAQEVFTTAQTINGVTFTPNADGSVKISGTATTATKVYLTYNLLNELVVGKTYISSIGQTVSGVKLLVEEDKDGSWVAFISNNINVSWNFNGLTTGNRVRVAINVANGTTVDATVYPQIEEGSTATSYEPYGLKPSPEFESPIMSVSGDVEARVEGENLLDISYAKAGYSVDANTGELVENVLNGCGENYIKVLPNTKYTISADKIVDAIRLSEYTMETAHIKRSQKSTSKYLTITTTENTRYLRWSLNYDGPNSVTVTTEMLENLKLRLTLGSDIKPYTEGPKTVPLPLGDIELRSTPDGTRDTFARVDGVWNYCNYAPSLIFDGSDDETWGGQGGVSDTENRLMMSLNTGIARDYKNRVSCCNRFKYYNDGTVQDANVDVTAFNFNPAANNSHYVYFKIEKSLLSTPDVAGWRSWLASNPLEVVCPVKTPTYTPITDSALISALDELEQLILHKGYNRITVTGVNGVKAYLELEIAPTALLTNISETEAGLNMPVPVVSEAGDVLVKVPKAENQMTINPATGVVNVKGLTINGVSLDAYIRSIIG